MFKQIAIGAVVLIALSAMVVKNVQIQAFSITTGKIHTISITKTKYFTPNFETKMNVAANNQSILCNSKITFNFH